MAARTTRSDYVEPDYSYLETELDLPTSAETLERNRDFLNALSAWGQEPTFELSGAKKRSHAPQPPNDIHVIDHHVSAPHACKSPRVAVADAAATGISPRASSVGIVKSLSPAVADAAAPRISPRATSVGIVKKSI
jgi:hypothetical protein